MFKKLTIVSDTAIYECQGSYFAFGPVVRELDFLDDLFDEITWIGFNRNDRLNDLSMQEIKSKKIKVVFLKNVGGKTIGSFLKVIIQYPVMLFVIFKHSYGAQIVHTRAPSHPALIAILMSFFFKKKKWWNKYAGNWNQVKPSMSYGFQRYILSKATFSSVTINGFWEDQPKHCHSFENPCLTDLDIQNGKEVATFKTFEAPFVFSFVGRLEEAKGVGRIIEALKEIETDKISKVHFVGNGSLEKEYKEMMSFLGDKVFFHGFLGKEKVHEILKTSHFFLLPSDSEGFPKVVAEAACYGVIPIVSNVGSIPHYVNESNGFLWDIKNEISYGNVLQNAIAVSSESLNVKSNNILKLAEKFTFAHYKDKLIQILPHS